MKSDPRDIEFFAKLAATIAASVIASARKLDGSSNLKPELIAQWSVRCATEIVNETVDMLEASPEPYSESAAASETESETVEEDLQPQEPGEGKPR